jgi:hypothetical protein
VSISGDGAHTGLRRYGVGGFGPGRSSGHSAHWGPGRRSWWATAAVGLAFVFEPAAWKAREGFWFIPTDVRHGEYLVGLCILALGVAASVRRASAPD